MGLLTEIDGDAFAEYCQAKARRIQAEREIAKGGAVISSGEKGYLAPSPWVAIARQEREAVARFGARFGLTPADRVGLETREPSPPDELDDFLRARAAYGVLGYAFQPE